MFILWDRLLGTYAEEHEAPVYGLTHPLRSWDPLWASVHYFFEVYDRLTLKTARAETWAQKLKLLYKGTCLAFGFPSSDSRF
jgi:alkylglycerol monooxygenase